METKDVKCNLYHDNFQNWKRYEIKKAQLIIADIPYNLGQNAYASNPVWYEGGITKTVKVIKQKNHSSIVMDNLKLLNICTFVLIY